MTEKELRERIRKGENYHTEFKVNLVDKNKIAKEIVCFANTNGGQLIFGVTDDGEISGIEDIDRAMKVIDDVAYQNCEPPITVIQETLEIDGKVVLIVQVPTGSQRPYKTFSGQYYIRSANRCRQASREELLRLFQASESIYFDETTFVKAEYSDLDLYEVQRFMGDFLEIKANESEIKNYLKNLHLTDKSGQPTVAGVLFFARAPQQMIPRSRVLCAYIEGTDIATPPMDKEEINGRIPDLLDKVQKYMKLYLREEHVIKGFEPEVRHEIPEVVLRESIVNAVTHRDYTIDAPIRVIVYTDRVEIRTPGKLPNSVTIDSIKIGGSHVLRNPTIYNMLYKMGMVTDMGSGVRRMITLVKKHSGKEVGLLETTNEFILTLPRP